MPGRPTALLGAVVLTTTVLAGCSADDEPVSGAQPSAAGSAAASPATGAAPDASATASEAPVDQPSEIPPASTTPPPLPTDLPTSVPTDLGDIDVGDCAELYEAVLEATGAVEEAMADPTASAEIFGDISTALREGSAGNSAEVAAAAEELATLYDEMGTIVGSGDPTAFASLDIDRLTTAATALQEACLG